MFDILRFKKRVAQITAGAINLLPMSGGQNCEFVWRDDQPLPQPGQFADYDGPTCLEIRVVSPDYFRAMGIPVRRGRAFTARDDSDAPPVAILNESAAALAARLDVTSGQEMIGKQVTLYETRDWIPNVSREVVGVVGDVRDIGLSVEPTVVMYVPHAQELDPGRRDRMTLVVRTERDPTEGAEAVWAAISGVDERLSISRVQTMSAVMNRSIAGPRFRTTLLLIFGAVAPLLAAVGVAGVVGYAISQRIPEIGQRIALGAQTRDVYTTVMSQGIRLMALGLALGLVGALAATRALSGLVYGVSPSDPLTYLAVSLLMVSIASLAIWVPARTALRVDPVKVLDAE